MTNSVYEYVQLGGFKHTFTATAGDNILAFRLRRQSAMRQVAWMQRLAYQSDAPGSQRNVIIAARIMFFMRDKV